MKEHSRSARARRRTHRQRALVLHRRGRCLLHEGTSFRAVVKLDAAHAVRVRPGQPALVEVEGLPGSRFTGRVLSATPGPSTRAPSAYLVTIAIDRADPRLRDGLAVHVSITTHTQAAELVVPNSAVIRMGDQFLVDVLTPDGRRERVQFQPGAIGDDNTQVLAGLHEGQQVILTH